MKLLQVNWYRVMDESEIEAVFHNRIAWFSSSVRYSLKEKWGKTFACCGSVILLGRRALYRAKAGYSH